MYSLFFLLLALQFIHFYTLYTDTFLLATKSIARRDRNNRLILVIVLSLERGARYLFTINIRLFSPGKHTEWIYFPQNIL